jgi:hypothetical protein
MHEQVDASAPMKIIPVNMNDAILEGIDGIEHCRPVDRLNI